MTLRHRNDQVGSPWRNTTAGPLPSSMWASRSPWNLRYFGLNGKSGRLARSWSGVRTTPGTVYETIAPGGSSGTVHESLRGVGGDRDLDLRRESLPGDQVECLEAVEHGLEGGGLGPAGVAPGDRERPPGGR